MSVKIKQVFIRNVVVLAAVAVLIMVISWIILGRRIAENVGTINNYQVSMEEFQLYANQQVNAVGAWFYQNYGADVNQEDFWDTEFGGETPKNKLIESTKQKITEANIILISAKEYDLGYEADFDITKKAFVDENQDRENKTESGVVIYGPEQYSMEQYLAYVQEAAIDDLKTYLLDNELAPSEEQLREAYESLDKGIIDKGYSAVVVRFQCFDFQRTEEVFTNIRKNQSEGMGISEIILVLEEQYKDIISSDTLELSLANMSLDNTSLQALYEEYRNVWEGSFIEQVIGTSGGKELHYVLSKEDYGQMVFEEAIRYAQIKWINDQFAIYSEKKVETAEILWNDTAISNQLIIQ